VLHNARDMNLKSKYDSIAGPEKPFAPAWIVLAAATPEELMIFPDTHEAIIDQDTWDIAQKLRVRAKPRAANGTYSHRLSGMIYCADCGSRMGFISPEARQSGKHYDSDSAFQCGNYRNQNNECVSHFIKTSALEAAILQAIKAVSQYVIENEAEFISQLKTVWNESKSKSACTVFREILICILIIKH
jgi:hypothetical protein